MIMIVTFVYIDWIYLSIVLYVNKKEFEGVVDHINSYHSFKIIHVISSFNE
jgi:hypothetical protein